MRDTTSLEADLVREIDLFQIAQERMWDAIAEYKEAVRRLEAESVRVKAELARKQVKQPLGTGENTRLIAEMVFYKLQLLGFLPTTLAYQGLLSREQDEVEAGIRAITQR